MTYIELTIDLEPRVPFSEILTVQLADIGFDSFVDTPTGIIAYADSSKTSVEQAINETWIGEQQADVKVSFSVKMIENQNWNALWESNFEPIFIDDKLSILAPFHDRKLAKGIVVEIQPQMSFGTGHHPTTYMMAQALLGIEIVCEKILDMGTGTGVLAILSEKLYPKAQIVGIDIEEDALNNAKENAQRNNCQQIEFIHGDIDLIPNEKHDLILANINKNTLKKHIPTYAQHLQISGKILLSGFFETDVDDLITIAQQNTLKLDKVSTSNTWACIQLSYE